MVSALPVLPPHSEPPLLETSSRWSAFVQKTRSSRCSVAVAKAKRSPHAKIRPSSPARRERTQQAKGVLTVEGQHACKLASKAQAQTSVGSIRNFETEKFSLTQILTLDSLLSARPP